MVNASLNWASIVGIVLAVGGALLYFMRSFKPALARDYDVFFAAVGLLCGGILFFQGWRLDPILQFGQFLLAGTTVFFAYESVRLRGVTTEQAKRSSYFDDEEPGPEPVRPRVGGGGWADDRDRFDEPQPLRRRIRSRAEDQEPDDFYRPSRPPSRAAIPERAASRRDPQDLDRGLDRGGWRDTAAVEDQQVDGPDRAMAGRDTSARTYSAGANRNASADFGSRRREREATADSRRGSRASAAAEAMPRSSRRAAPTSAESSFAGAPRPAATTPARPGEPRNGEPRPSAPGVPLGTPISGSSRAASAPGAAAISDADFSPLATGSRPGAAVPGSAPAGRGGAAGLDRSGESRPRDNSSRFDD
jgi:hypothetical protein